MASLWFLLVLMLWSTAGALISIFALYILYKLNNKLILCIIQNYDPVLEEWVRSFSSFGCSILNMSNTSVHISLFSFNVDIISQPSCLSQPDLQWMSHCASSSCSQLQQLRLLTNPYFHQVKLVIDIWHPQWNYSD